MKRPSKAVLRVFLVIAILAFIYPFDADIYCSVTMRSNIDDTNEENVFIYDGADLLSTSEENMLRNDMLPVTAFAPVAFSSTNDTFEYIDEVRYVRARYEEIFGNGPGILLSIDMDKRQIYIWTDNGNTKLSSVDADTITDNIYRFATAKQYYKCASRGMLQIYQTMSGNPIPEYMRHINNLLLSISLGLLITFIIAKKKTQIKSPANVYQLDENTAKRVKFADFNTVLVNRRTVRKETSSGLSGGHGGGHGGGFGGGGGGGHGGGHGF